MELIPKVSVIIPALNEEMAIQASVNSALEAFRKLGVYGEIIVIDDGSTDRTSEIVKAMQSQFQNIRLISHGTPQGLGQSYWHGVRESKADVITWNGGSYESHAYEILRYFSLLDHVDIITPYLFNIEQKSMHRRFLSNTFKKIINFTFDTQFNYTNGLLFYRKKILDGLSFRSSGYLFSAELLIKTTRRGYLFAEVPFSMRKRKQGRSRIKFSSVIAVCIGYIRLIYDVYFQNQPLTSFPQGTATNNRWKQTRQGYLVDGTISPQ